MYMYMYNALGTYTQRTGYTVPTEQVLPSAYYTWPRSIIELLLELTNDFLDVKCTPQLVS